MARQHRDSAKQRYWRQHLARWRRSGLGVRAYCRAEGLSEPSFYVWRRLLTKPQQPTTTPHSLPATPAFVPVRLIDEPTRGGVLEVVLRGGRVVRVPSPFRAETLREVVAVLEGLPC